MTKVLLDTDKAAVIGAVSGATVTDAGTPASDDKVLIQDTSDSDNLKYVNISDLPGGTVDVLSNVATDRILGRTTAGSGDSEELTASATRTFLNVEDGATADQTGAQIKTAYEAEANAFTDTKNTKLSGIEAGADVTDATNVTSAGALMDSEVTNLTQVKAFDSTDYAAALGADDNYVTDAEKTVIGNTSGTNSGDQDLSALAPIANPTFTGEIGIGSVNVSETELGILEGATATTAELNILDGVTATTAELNILDGVTATASELNKMDGVTATTAEINYVDGVTSNVQTQLDAKLTATAYDDATAAEVDTGTSTAKYVSPDSLEGSKYGVRTIVRDVIAHDADQATGTTLGGDFVMPIGGTVIEVGITVSTAGTTGVGTYDIHKNGTTILSTKITVDSGEKTSRTAATDSVISVAAVAEGDIYTFDIDGVQTTEAKGAQFFIKIRE